MSCKKPAWKQFYSHNNIEWKIKIISQSITVDLNLAWNLLLCRDLLKKIKQKTTQLKTYLA